MKTEKITSPDYPTTTTETNNVLSLFEEIAIDLPNKIALQSSTGTLTYKELDTQSNVLAALLLKSGLSPGSIVSICTQQSIRRVIAYLAILKTGAAYLPIDGQLPEERIKMMLEDSATDLIITEDTYLSRFTDTNIQLFNLDQDITSYEPSIDTSSPDIEILPDQTAYIIYTSGSTGRPKGVVIHHEAFFHFVKSFGEQWGYSSENRVLQFGSPSFDVYVMDLWIPLLNGATIFLYPDNKIVGRSLLEYIVEHEIDFVPNMPPAVLSTLPTNTAIGKLHTIFAAGEVSSEQAIKSWHKRVRLINAYGPTETTVCSISYHFDEDTNPHIIGKPISAADVYILDSNLQPTDHNITGEIYIGGILLSKGYLNRPEETKKAFIEAPEWLKAEKGEKYRLYKTGDRAFLRPDGNIEFIGRMDDQVKIRGFRIELKEIEHHIGQLAQVAHVAVKVHRPDEGIPFLAAFIQLYEEDRNKVSLEDIRSRLKQSLPTYMLPERIVLLEKLPLSHTGKVDKSQLHLRQTQNIKKSQTFVDTKDLRQEIRDIWSTLLNRDHLNDDDNFFDMGGHSLMLAQMHENLPHNVQRRISLPELYSFPTINLFVHEVENRLKQNEQSQQQRASQVEEILIKDAQLPFDFEITVQPDPQILANPSKILLTGVTGFVGSHLLEELIPKNPDALIYCLVRAENEKLAIERIKSTFHKFKLVWKPAYESRIVILLGDLTEHQLGLPNDVYDRALREIEVIYHMGSNVSYVQPYEYIKKPNVDGMANILHLAVHVKTKFLIISSSTGIYSWGRTFTGKTWVYEDEPIEPNLPAVCRDMGYIRSKWVMESMASKAKDKGLPLIIFRLGFVVCHGETGATPLNQWWSSLMRSCIELKSFPYIMGLKDEVVTVDYVCKAIAHISKKPEAIGVNFNLNPLPEHDLSLTDFCVRITDYCGLEMKGTDFKTWFDQWRINQELPLFPLLYLFTDDVHEGKSLAESYENTYYFKSLNAERFLADSDIRPAIFDKKVIEAYLRFMKMI